jgi:hypothetical protein
MAGGEAGEAIGQPDLGVAAPLDPRGEVAIVASDTPQEQVKEVLRGVSQAEVDERQEAQLVLEEYRRQEALAATPLQRAALDRLQAWDADTTGHFTTEQAFDLVRWAEKQLGAEQKRAAAEALVGSWTYGSCGIYTVAYNSGGRLFYTEGATKEKRTGLLVSDGEWFGATLRTSGADIIGFIRLQYVNGEITSNFRKSEDAPWGNDVVATKAAPEEAAQMTCEWQKCGLFCAVAFGLLAVWMLLIGFAYLSVDTAVMEGGAFAESSTGRLIGTSNVLRKHSFGSLMTMPVGDLRHIDACTLAHRGAYLVLRVASLTRSPEGDVQIISPERSVLHITRGPAGEQVTIERPFGTREAVDFSKQGYPWLPNAPDAVGCTLAIATVAPPIQK